MTFEFQIYHSSFFRINMCVPWDTYKLNFFSFLVYIICSCFSVYIHTDIHTHIYILLPNIISFSNLWSGSMHWGYWIDSCLLWWPYSQIIRAREYLFLCHFGPVRIQNTDHRKWHQPLISTLQVKQVSTAQIYSFSSVMLRCPVIASRVSLCWKYLLLKVTLEINVKLCFNSIPWEVVNRWENYVTIIVFARNWFLPKIAWMCYYSLLSSWNAPFNHKLQRQRHSYVKSLI